MAKGVFERTKPHVNVGFGAFEYAFGPVSYTHLTLPTN